MSSGRLLINTLFPSSGSHYLQCTVEAYCRFCICKFAYSLKLVRNNRVYTQGALAFLCRHVKNSEKFELPETHVPS